VVNVKVKTKPAWETLPDVLALVKAAEQKLGAEGRVFLRYSGTEPKARLLIEGRDRQLIQELADQITGRLRERIGA
jgi:phosphoglucosamine mutase